MGFGVFKTGCFLVSLTAVSALASADPAPPPQVAVKEDPSQKVVCRRFVETGSLAKMRKECHTADEWQRASERNRQNAKDLVNSALTSSGTSN